MQYKVVPFIAALNGKKKISSQSAAEQLEALIQAHSSEGWEYVSLESVTTYVQGSSGCFGAGGSESYFTTRQMVVFRR